MPVLNEISTYELDMGEPGWREVYGTPLYWAPDGFDWLALSPAPYGGGLQLEGYREPPTLDRDTEFIDLGDEELVRILDYAQWYLSFKEGIQEGLDNTQELMKNMMAAAALRNSRLLKSAMYREYMGEHRQEWERGTRSPAQKIGVRRKP
jgi:hypothetical protein